MHYTTKLKIVKFYALNIQSEKNFLLAIML